MPIKLNSTGGGSVTLDTPSTANNYTLLIPATNGSLATTTGTTFADITDSGNLTFTGTGNRITGDFSNGTAANRVMFQTSTSNAGTFFGVVANGTPTDAYGTGFVAFANGDTASSHTASLYAFKNNDTRITSGSNTGTYYPMTFYTGGSERMRIDTSGNVGIGTNSPASNLHVAGAASTIRNAASSGSSWFVGSNVDSYILHNVSNTPMVFTTNSAERMRIDSSGNVGIGTSSPGSKLALYDGSAWSHMNGGNSAANGSIPWFASVNNASVASADYGWLWYNNAANGNLDLYRRYASTTGNQVLSFERSSGNLLVNTTATGAKLVVGAAEGAAFTKWYNSSNGGYWTVRLQGDGSSSNNLHFDNSGLGDVMVLRSGGTIQAPYIGTNTGTAMVLDGSGYLRVSSSSRRYKENIEPIDVGLAEIMQMEPVKYDLIGSGTAQVGFIAEDFPEPRLVSYSMVDPADPSKGTQVESVNYANLTAILVKAVQELKAELDELKAKVNA